MDGRERKIRDVGGEVKRGIRGERTKGDDGKRGGGSGE